MPIRHEDNERYRSFTRRALLIGGGQAALFAVLAGRMYYLQVIEAERYATLAEDNRIHLRLLPPPRGRIVDRFGVPLAVNQQNYRVVLVREQARDVKRTLEALAEVIRLPEVEFERILPEAQHKRAFVPVPVRGDPTWAGVSRTGVSPPDLPGADHRPRAPPHPQRPGAGRALGRPRPRRQLPLYAERRSAQRRRGQAHGHRHGAPRRARLQRLLLHRARGDQHRRRPARRGHRRHRRALGPGPRRRRRERHADGPGDRRSRQGPGLRQRQAQEPRADHGLRPPGLPRRGPARATSARGFKSCRAKWASPSGTTSSRPWSRP